MKIAWRLTPADRRLLPEARFAGPMPWVIAIMIFLTVLAAAGGLALDSASGTLGSSLADRITIQIVDANKATRDRQATAASEILRKQPGVVSQSAVTAHEMDSLLEPWLGTSIQREDLPVPALIDVSLDQGTPDRVRALGAAVRRVAPAARIDDHGDFLKPLGGLLHSLSLLALAIVLLMASATAFTVILASRSALDAHRGTIDVMHLLGATDRQVARLFQWRIALDALFGALIGLACAVAVILGLGSKIGDVSSALVGTVTLPRSAWIVLLILPLGGVALAVLTARLTILNSLGRNL